MGLYGTVAYGVARRRTEIGVRLALGAASGRVLRMVLGEVALVVAAGLLLGVPATLSVTRLLQAFLFGLSPRDLPTLVASVVALAVAAGAAGAVPAWRAARLDPTVALREE